MPTVKIEVDAEFKEECRGGIKVCKVKGLS